LVSVWSDLETHTREIHQHHMGDLKPSALFPGRSAPSEDSSSRSLVLDP
jgi:hypothetical protein